MTYDSTDANALKFVLRYLWHDEKKHYEAMRENGEDTRKHVFPKLRRLRDLLQACGYNVDDLEE